MLGAPKPPDEGAENKLHRKIKISMIDLVRPELKTLLPAEIQFEVFRWMLQTGYPYHVRGQWGISGVFELLYGLSTVNSKYYPQDHGFSTGWREKLSEAFRRAFFGLHNSAAECWRADHGVSLDNQKWLGILHRTERWNWCGYPARSADTPVAKALDSIFAERGPLTTELNSCHPCAINISHILLTVCEDDGWVLLLHYGYEGSVWDHNIAAQRKGEAFCDFVVRARVALNALTKRGVE